MSLTFIVISNLEMFRVIRLGWNDGLKLKALLQP